MKKFKKFDRKKYEQFQKFTAAKNEIIEAIGEDMFERIYGSSTFVGRDKNGFSVWK